MGTVSNIKIEPMKVKFNGIDVGFCDGDIELNIAENLTEVMAHCAGTNVLSELRTGKTVEVTVTLKETSKAQLEAMLLGGEAIDATSYGYGLSKDFTHTFDDAQSLVLHPCALADTDKSRDFTFWKAYPKVETLTFSGENIFTIPVVFKIYPDMTKDANQQYFMIGE